MKYIKLIFLFALLGYAAGSSAQRRATKPVVAKYKPPKLFTSIGEYKDTMTVPAKDAATVIGLPLRITDAKNNIYTVSSYNFVYRQVVVTEDESYGGKPSLTTAIKSSLFKATPLPAIWLNAVRESPHPGEEYIFFDVIAKDAQGRVMYAPNLKLILK